MHRLLSEFRPSGLTITSGIAMSLGALLYLNDQIPRPRNLHTFLGPALVLMTIGVVIAVIGAVRTPR